jgi:hypothetical protein
MRRIALMLAAALLVSAVCLSACGGKGAKGKGVDPTKAKRPAGQVE